MEKGKEIFINVTKGINDFVQEKILLRGNQIVKNASQEISEFMLEEVLQKGPKLIKNMTLDIDEFVKAEVIEKGRMIFENITEDIDNFLKNDGPNLVSNVTQNLIYKGHDFMVLSQKAFRNVTDVINTFVEENIVHSGINAFVIAKAAIHRGRKNNFFDPGTGPHFFKRIS